MSLLGLAKDVCASVVLKQVWYNGLSSSYSRDYQNYANSLKKAVKLKLIVAQRNQFYSVCSELRTVCNNVNYLLLL